jgi:hypothetical protein
MLVEYFWRGLNVNSNFILLSVRTVEDTSVLPLCLPCLLSSCGARTIRLSSSAAAIPVGRHFPLHLFPTMRWLTVHAAVHHALPWMTRWMLPPDGPSDNAHPPPHTTQAQRPLHPLHRPHPWVYTLPCPTGTCPYRLQLGKMLP